MRVTSPPSHFAMGLHWDHSSCVVIKIRATCQNNPMTHPSICAWGREEGRRQCFWVSARQHKPHSLPGHFQALWVTVLLVRGQVMSLSCSLIGHWLGNLAVHGDVNRICFTVFYRVLLRIKNSEQKNIELCFLFLFLFVLLQLSKWLILGFIKWTTFCISAFIRGRSVCSRFCSSSQKSQVTLS